MKLASLKDGRDGRLVVVSNDLAWFAPADLVAPTLQAALEDWDRCEPLLRGLAESLEHGAVPRERFHERQAASPLPRGYLAPRDPIPMGDGERGLDLEGEFAVITGEAPAGCDRETAVAAIRLVMLCNEVALREAAFDQARPGLAFSPVAVTPDSLEGWRDGRLQAPLDVELNSSALGQPAARLDFGDLVQAAARAEGLVVGSIVGSGPVCGRDLTAGPAKTATEGGVGYACLAELRSFETLAYGAARTPFLKPGDVVRIEMRDARRHTVFGAIEQEVGTYERAGGGRASA